MTATDSGVGALAVTWPARQSEGSTPLGGVLHRAACRHVRRVQAADPDRVDWLDTPDDAWPGWDRPCGTCRPLAR